MRIFVRENKVDRMGLNVGHTLSGYGNDVWGMINGILPSFTRFRIGFVEIEFLEK
jgi:hypothetical protein